MNQTRRILLTCLLLLNADAVWGAVINDGSTTANLAAISTASEPGFDGHTTLTVVETNLVAAQEGLTFPLMRTVWYATSAIATSAVYTVSADFRPAADIGADYPGQGGVLGWLNTSAPDTKGIALQLSAYSFKRYVQVSVIDFLSETAAGIDSFQHLFNLDGTPATEDTARFPLPEAYAAAAPSTLELAFSAPTASDLSTLPTATARVTVRAWQGEGTSRLDLATATTFLTDLALPASAAHRFGYFGFWGSLADEGSTIGYFRTLSAQGDLQTVNVPPSVRLTLPFDGTIVAAGTSMTLAADASDMDGSVARVDFFSDATKVGTVLTPPYTIVWPAVPAGTNHLTAVAVDDKGASTTSKSVTVIGNLPPTVEIQAPQPNQVFTYPSDITIEADAQDADGIVTQLDFYAGTSLIGSLTSPPYSVVWTNADPGNHALTVEAMDDRGGRTTSTAVNISVRTQGQPPTLTVVLDANDQLVLQWASTGFQLQVSTDLLNWSDVPNTTSVASYTVPSTSVGKAYYRLVGSGVPTGPTLTIRQVGSQLSISWSPAGSYTLQVKNTLSDLTWQDVPSPTNPYLVNSGDGPQKFYRLKQ